MRYVYVSVLLCKKYHIIQVFEIIQTIAIHVQEIVMLEYICSGHEESSNFSLLYIDKETNMQPACNQLICKRRNNKLMARLTVFSQLQDKVTSG